MEPGKNTSRRNFLRTIAGVTSGLTLASFLESCTTVIPETTNGPTTGVPGLNTVAEIKNNNEVRNFLNNVENGLGYYLSLYEDLNAPNIEGEYDMNGRAWGFYNDMFNGPNELGQGAFNFRNQTSDGYIDLDYSQLLGQTGVGKRGRIIICGNSNGFTVYSILNVETFGLKSTNINIIDGFKKSDSELETKYIVVPTDNPSGLYAPTIGELNLNKTGAYKKSEKNLEEISKGYPIAGFLK